MIISVGSINMDLVVQVDRAPDSGETVLGSDYVSHSGGKGANQAVAAARLGASVQMVGALGSDAFGADLLESLRAANVGVDHVQRFVGSSGVAFITVEPSGQNRIIVAPGANGLLQEESLPKDAFRKAAVVLLQLEVPVNVTLAAARLGRAAGARVLLNAAPPVPDLLGKLGNVDVLIVNEIEAGSLLGKRRAESVEVAREYARELARYVPDVIVTLGEKGAVWQSPAGSGMVPATPVEVVDTTGAGDAFVGALGAALLDGLNLEAAVAFASAAGALTVTVSGAQSALPDRAAVKKLLAAESQTNRAGAKP